MFASDNKWCGKYLDNFFFSVVFLFSPSCHNFQFIVLKLILSTYFFIFILYNFVLISYSYSETIANIEYHFSNILPPSLSITDLEGFLLWLPVFLYFYSFLKRKTILLHVWVCYRFLSKQKLEIDVESSVDLIHKILKGNKFTVWIFLFIRLLILCMFIQFLIIFHSCFRNSISIIMVKCMYWPQTFSIKKVPS